MIFERWTSHCLASTADIYILECVDEFVISKKQCTSENVNVKDIVDVFAK